MAVKGVVWRWCRKRESTTEPWPSLWLAPVTRILPPILARGQDRGDWRQSEPPKGGSSSVPSSWCARCKNRRIVRTKARTMLTARITTARSVGLIMSRTISGKQDSDLRPRRWRRVPHLETESTARNGPVNRAPVSARVFREELRAGGRCSPPATGGRWRSRPGGGRGLCSAAVGRCPTSD